MKRQWALDGVSTAFCIQCKASAAEDSSSPWIAPMTSTRIWASGATTSR